MRHANVAIFVPHNGCPNQCSFCNQKSITGQSGQPDEQDVVSALETALESLKEKSREAEIAFFGGSFTAIERGYMLRLLKAAEPYLPRFKGIRISTRPDCIDEEILKVLEQYKISAIELGVQSMSDTVLSANNRGHTALDVYKSCEMIKSRGISLGLQMMTNLYKSTKEDDFYTAEEFIKIQCDTVRIYPTQVLAGTLLEQLYRRNLHTVYTLEESIDECAQLLEMFNESGIKVIRLGLHSGGGVDESRIAGAYHPAFRQLCESRIILKKILKELNVKKPQEGKSEIYKIEILTAPENVSTVTGQKKSNLSELLKHGFDAVVKADKNLKNSEFAIRGR